MFKFLLLSLLISSALKASAYSLQCFCSSADVTQQDINTIEHGPTDQYCGSHTTDGGVPDAGCVYCNLDENAVNAIIPECDDSCKSFGAKSGACIVTDGLFAHCPTPKRDSVGMTTSSSNSSTSGITLSGLITNLVNNGTIPESFIDPGNYYSYDHNNTHLTIEAKDDVNTLHKYTYRFGSDDEMKQFNLRYQDFDKEDHVLNVNKPKEKLPCGQFCRNSGECRSRNPSCGFCFTRSNHPFSKRCLF